MSQAQHAKHIGLLAHLGEQLGLLTQDHSKLLSLYQGALAEVSTLLKQVADQARQLVVERDRLAVAERSAAAGFGNASANVAWLVEPPALDSPSISDCRAGHMWRSGTEASHRRVCVSCLRPVAVASVSVSAGGDVTSSPVHQCGGGGGPVI